MTGKYHKGTYHPDGISLYALAEDVLTDAGVDPREYFIDPYLKKGNGSKSNPHSKTYRSTADDRKCGTLHYDARPEEKNNPPVFLFA